MMNAYIIYMQAPDLLALLFSEGVPILLFDDRTIKSNILFEFISS